MGEKTARCCRAARFAARIRGGSGEERRNESVARREIGSQIQKM
jgi:hypothetical protein